MVKDEIIPINLKHYLLQLLQPKKIIIVNWNYETEYWIYRNLFDLFRWKFDRIFTCVSRICDRQLVFSIELRGWLKSSFGYLKAVLST